MGRVCLGPSLYGSSFLWAEFAWAELSSYPIKAYKISSVLRAKHVSKCIKIVSGRPKVENFLGRIPPNPP